MMPRRGLVALVMLGGALATPRTASAGLVGEIKGSVAGTTYGGMLGEHVESPGSDGGLFAFGWHRGDLTLLVVVVGRDVNTVNGGREDNLHGIGPGVRFDRPLWWRVSGWLRGGVEIVDLAGAMGTTLESAWGWDANVGAGLGVRLFRMRDKGGEADVVLTAEVLTQAMHLYPEDAKRIDGSATSMLFGFEVRTPGW